jgi:hypothetical protein
MVQAQASGAIDFHEFDQFNPRWFARSNAILAELARQNKKQFYTFLQELLQQTLTNPDLEPEHRKTLVEQRSKLLQELQACYHPYQDDANAKKEEKEQFVTGMRQWESVWGSLDSPETQENIDRIVGLLKRRTKPKERKIKPRKHPAKRK